MQATDLPFIPEIVLPILAELPQVDLLLAQRVCRTWCDIIKNSKALQRALFFRAEVATGDSETAVNPLLRLHFPGFLGIATGNRFLWTSSRWQDAALQDLPDLDKIQAYAFKHASWRRMLPFCPAPRELQVIERTIEPTGSFGTFRKMEFGFNEAGEGAYLQFGLIYDLIQKYQSPADSLTNTQCKIGGTGNSTGETMQSSSYLPEHLIRREIRRINEALPGEDYLGHACAVIVVDHHRPNLPGYSEDPMSCTYPAELLRSDGYAEDMEDDTRWSETRSWLLHGH